MAKVVGPLFSLTASGNFRGLMEFRTGEVIVGSPKTQKPPRSPAQQAQAARFQTAVEAWRDLSEADQTNWKTAGASRGLSGYQIYVSEYLIQGITPPGQPLLPP